MFIYKVHLNVDIFWLQLGWDCTYPSMASKEAKAGILGPFSNEREIHRK